MINLYNINFKFYLLGSRVGVVDYTRTYKVMDVVQELISYLYYLPELVLFINTIILWAFILKYSKTKLSDGKVNIWWIVFSAYIISAYFRQLMYGNYSIYINCDISLVKLFLFAILGVSIELCYKSIGIKHILPLILLALPITLVLGSKSMLLTALLLEVIFIITVLWSLIGLSRSSARGVIQYFVINSIGGGLFILGVSNYYLHTGTGMYYTYNSLPYVEKLGVICFAVSFLIKVASAPFHYWAIDVINSFSNILLILYVQVISKLIVILIYYRIFIEVLPDAINIWSSILIGSSLLSTVLGVLANSYQYKLKEFLSLSSLVHISLISTVLSLGLPSTNKLALIYTIIYSILSLLVWYTLLREADFSTGVSNLLSNNINGHYYSVILMALSGFPPSPLFILKVIVFLSIYLCGLKSLFIVLLALNTINYINYLRLVKIANT